MKNVIFDLGGVVFDWNPHAIVDVFVRELNLDVEDAATLGARVKNDVFYHPDWLETDRGTLSAADAVRRFARRLERPQAEMERLWEICNEAMRPKDETVALIHELRERCIPLYVLSNMPVERYAYLEQKHDFWPLFQGIVISGTVKLIKPDAAIYRHLLTRHELRAGTCAFLDDSEPNVNAARALGMHAIHFQSAAQSRPELERWLSQ